MRLLLLLVCLSSTVASASRHAPPLAQGEPASAPPDEPEWARPPPGTGPAEPPGERAERYSRFSAGPGGPSVVVTEVLLGLLGGGALGSSYDSDGRATNLYSGAMLGGLTLGTAGVLYQYFHPVERKESLLSTLASLAGMSAGVGFAKDARFSDRGRALLALAGSQVGMFATLLLTSGGPDISGADVGLISISSFYSVLIAGLVELIDNGERSGGEYNFAPMLMAPAIGMAMGGLLSIPLEMNGLSFALITTVPLVTSGLAVALAAPLSGKATTGRVVLITLTGSLGLTALITTLISTSTSEGQSYSSVPSLLPVPVVLAAGRHNTGLAVGPGVALQF